jgi:hypothetical protein
MTDNQTENHIQTALEQGECPPGTSQCDGEPEACRECWEQHFAVNPVEQDDE